jgi:hypothetical protein
MLPLLIVASSMLLQVAAGVHAIRLVRFTPERLCWGLIAAGLWGMALRRAVSLAEVVKVGSFSRIDLPYEAIGFVTSLCMFLGVTLIAPLFRRLRDSEALRESARREQEETLRQLQESLENVKLLTGLLPVCTSCKKIRDDSGSWHPMESYIQTRTDARFSHGFCPECMWKLYPDYRPYSDGSG